MTRIVWLCVFVLENKLKILHLKAHSSFPKGRLRIDPSKQRNTILLPKVWKIGSRKLQWRQVRQFHSHVRKACFVKRKESNVNPTAWAWDSKMFFVTRRRSKEAQLFHRTVYWVQIQPLSCGTMVSKFLNTFSKLLLINFVLQTLVPNTLSPSDRIY